MNGWAQVLGRTELPSCSGQRNQLSEWSECVGRTVLPPDSASLAVYRASVHMTASCQLGATVAGEMNPRHSRPVCSLSRSASDSAVRQDWRASISKTSLLTQTTRV